MDIDINSEPGYTADKHVDSKNQADSPIEISKSSCDSMKVVPDKFEKIALFLSGLTLESSQQKFLLNRHRELCHQRDHIHFPLTMPKNGNNQIFPLQKVY